MKVTRTQLVRIIKETVLNELVPGAIGGPGMGGGSVPAEKKGKRQKPIEQQASEYIGTSVPSYAARSLAQPIAEIIVGFTPAGFVVDAKDLTVALTDIYSSGGEEGYVDLGLAALGFVPGVGDGAKAASRALRTSAQGVSKVVGSGKKLSDASAEAYAEATVEELKNKDII